jgi:hypothetical protein
LLEIWDDFELRMNRNENGDVRKVIEEHYSEAKGMIETMIEVLRSRIEIHEEREIAKAEEGGSWFELDDSDESDEPEELPDKDVAL